MILFGLLALVTVIVVLSHLHAPPEQESLGQHSGPLVVLMCSMCLRAFVAVLKHLCIWRSALHELQVSIMSARPGIGRGLMTTVGHREGEKILDLPCLWYDNVDDLNAFLRSPGNSHFSNKTIVIPGVKKQEQPVDLYAVLLGAGQYINHYMNIKRGPNSKLVFKHTGLPEAK